MNAACCCSSPLCLQYGCQRQMPPCQQPGFYQPPLPRGCVCPPGAEQTCQGWQCPRKPLSTATYAGHVSESPS